MDNIRHFLGKLKTAKVRAGYQMVLLEVKSLFSHVLLNETSRVLYYFNTHYSNIPKNTIKSFQHQLPKK